MPSQLSSCACDNAGEISEECCALGGCREGSREPIEPAERDPGQGWLRSRLYRAPVYRQWSRFRMHGQVPASFTPLPWPRSGHNAACGRNVCPVCGPKNL